MLITLDLTFSRLFTRPSIETLSVTIGVSWIVCCKRVIGDPDLNSKQIGFNLAKKSCDLLDPLLVATELTDLTLLQFDILSKGSGQQILSRILNW